MKSKIVFKVEKGDEGFWAYSDDLPGVTSYSNTYSGIRKEIQEALDLYYEDEGEGEPPEFKAVLDVKQFLAHYSFFNVSALAEAVGINASLMRQYAKGLKTPGEKQSWKILSGLNHLAKRLQSELV